MPHSRKPLTEVDQFEMARRKVPSRLRREFDDQNRADLQFAGGGERIAAIAERGRLGQRFDAQFALVGEQLRHVRVQLLDLVAKRRRRLEEDFKRQHGQRIRRRRRASLSPAPDAAARRPRRLGLEPAPELAAFDGCGPTTK